MSANPVATVCFYDVPSSEKPDYSEYRGATKITNLTHITDAAICNAPTLPGLVRNVQGLSIFNNQDASNATVVVKIDDGGTDTIIMRQVLGAGETLVYEDGAGWGVL